MAPKNAAECRALNEELLKTPPALASAAVVSAALKAFGKDIAIAFSGAEDVYVIELAARSGLPYRVFSLDTGRLHKETYEYFAAIEKHYGFRIEYCVPPQAELQALVRAKGQFSFFTDGHAECCTIRKVLPLKQQLSTLRAWVTGLRADQSPSTRSALPYCEIDAAFPGAMGAPLVKFNPLANETSSSVWAALRAGNVPVNELHSQGYVSVGCQPCTRPVLPNAHEREGRWWWEDAEGKECGLHKKK